MSNSLMDTLADMKDVASILKQIRDAAKEDDGISPNPLFVANGIEGKSPNTRRVMKYRKIKAIGSSIFSFGGKAGAAGTAGVNVADAVKHGAAAGSTSVHLYRLSAMAEKIKDGGSLKAYLDLIITLKGGKLLTRGMSLAAAVIPVPGLGIVATAGSQFQKRVLVKSAEEAILRTAFALHWRAYRELVLVRGSTSEGGPALRILRELITVSATNAHKRLKFLDFGNLHCPQLLNDCIREPGGYLIVKFKLEQM